MPGRQLANSALERQSGSNPIRFVPSVQARMSTRIRVWVDETGSKGVSVVRQSAVLTGERISVVRRFGVTHPANGVLRFGVRQGHCSPISRSSVSQHRSHDHCPSIRPTGSPTSRRCPQGQRSPGHRFSTRGISVTGRPRLGWRQVARRQRKVRLRCLRGRCSRIRVRTCLASIFAP